MNTTKSKYFIAASKLLTDDEEITLVGFIQDHLDGVVTYELSDNPDVIIFPSAGTEDKFKVRDGLEAFCFMHSQEGMDKQPLLLGFGRGANRLNTFNGGTNVKTKGHYLLDDESYNGIAGYLHHSVEYFGKNKTGTFGSRINSFHHYEMKPPDNGKEKHNPYGVLARCFTVNAVQYPSGREILNEGDIEAIWYPVSRSLCVQWSPEYDPTGQAGQLFKRVLAEYGDLSNAEV